MEETFLISQNYYGLNIEKIEKQYGVSYIGDFSIKDNAGHYISKPVSVFYQENPNTELKHSHYMGIFGTYFHNAVTNETKIISLHLCDAKSAFDEPLVGLKTKNGPILISCYDHHYNEYKDEFIDGGRSYTRASIDSEMIKVSIDKDKLVII